MRTVNADVTEHFLKQGYYDMPTSECPDNGRADNVVLREQESKLQERQTPLEICEMICDQSDTAYDGYINIMNDLQACDHQTAKDFLIDKESMQRELANWLTAGSNERIDYIMDALMVDPKLHFTLITVPNMPVDDKQIISLFNGFAKRNNMESSINFNTQIDLAKYTAEQLSGCKKGKQKIRFGLMPSKPNAEIPAKTASEQCESLAELKKTDKFLCAPSILDSVVYYQTLYSGGSNFHNNRDYQHNVTYIRNYSLAPTYCGKEPYVLSACIVSNGVEVMGSLANRPQVAYTMVG